VTDELRAKLARLRRESPPRARAESGELGEVVLTPARGLPEWFTTRATHLATHFAAEEPAGAARSLDAPADLCEIENTRGRFAARTRSYPESHAHGDVLLTETRSAAPAELAWLARDPALAKLDPARCVYLDIETTGLAGGAGTIPFLVALGTFEDGAFRLWQAFLRDPGEEAAALSEVAERVRAASGVVSFFGKAFDRHRLEDKMRLYRIAPPFEGKPHLDLYHPLRRLYRGAYLDGRLATFERELCGVERAHDLPGSLAPAAWFDFLAARAHQLEAVFRHNELDVLSLVTLAAHLARARCERRPDGSMLPGAARARARALAALHARARQHERALEWLELALTRGGSDEGELWFERADCLRRLRAHERALEAFLRLARERKDALAARAWAEVHRLARRLKRAELVEESLTAGPAAAERTLTGKSRARLLARFNA
jgi:hypothetical protein